MLAMVPIAEIVAVGSNRTGRSRKLCFKLRRFLAKTVLIPEMHTLSGIAS